jgi:hypothetical protein
MVLAIVLMFSLRGYFLQKAIEKIALKFKTKYQTELIVENASFKGLSGVEFKKIKLVPQNGDTLASIDYFSASVRFWYLLIADIRIKDVNLKQGYFSIVNQAGYKNFASFLPQKDSLKTDTSVIEFEENVKQINYARVVYRLISKLFSQVPNQVSIENFDLKLNDHNNILVFKLNDLTLNDRVFDSHITIDENKAIQQWKINGTAHTNLRQADLNFSRTDSAMVQIPYLYKKIGLKAGFNSIRLQLEGFDFEDEMLSIKGSAAIENFLINHYRIANANVMINKAAVQYKFLFGTDFISLDSSTTITFNQTKFHPFFKLIERKAEQNTQVRKPRNKENYFYKFFDKYIVSFNIKSEKTVAQDFINSLPEALFSNVKGMEASGSFVYRLDFYLDIHKPNEMVFESSIDKENLLILGYGKANLAKLNGSFLHTPYEKGIAKRSFIVGPENPNYTPYELISPYLKSALLTTEDPSFMYHRGFVSEAFRQSIAKNIRSGRFARGASTISMQLVKNVFLTREKTMARKLEEILLVYILENNHLVSKQRMFEVYLNLIEWGPNIYGVGEASRFYFQKAPLDLNLKEALFLATIVPSPKGFMYKFGKDGNIKPYLENSFKFLSNKMIHRGLIPIGDTSVLGYKLNFSGLAKNFIVISDTISNDSLILDENGMIIENDEKNIRLE